MNRKQRREALKETGIVAPNGKQSLPLAPLSIEGLIKKYPDITLAVEAYAKKCNLDGRNEVFNTLLGCTMITLHDKYDFTADQMNTLIAQVLNQMECITMGFVTETDILGAIVDIGVLVEGFDYGKVKQNLDETMYKLKSYKELSEDMTKQDKAFELFEKGITDTKEVADKAGCPISSVYKYKQLWRQSKITGMSVDEFTDKLFADNTAVTEPQAVETKKEDELHTEKESTCESTSQANTQEVKTRKPATINKEFEDAVKEMEEQNKKEVKKMGLKVITEVVRIEGEFVTYKPVDKAWEIEIDGQVILLSKQQLSTLSAEFAEVANQ